MLTIYASPLLLQSENGLIADEEGQTKIIAQHFKIPQMCRTTPRYKTTENETPFQQREDQTNSKTP